MTIVDKAMANSVPILFWTSVIMFFGGAAMVLLPSMTDPSIYSSQPGIGPGTFVTSIVSGLNSATWPFLGAAIVWSILRNKAGGASE